MARRWLIHTIVSESRRHGTTVPLSLKQLPSCSSPRRLVWLLGWLSISGTANKGDVFLSSIWGKRKGALSRSNVDRDLQMAVNAFLHWQMHRKDSWKYFYLSWDSQYAMTKHMGSGRSCKQTTSTIIQCVAVSPTSSSTNFHGTSYYISRYFRPAIQTWSFHQSPQTGSRPTAISSQPRFR